MADNNDAESRESWHQSLGGIVAILVFGAIVTSPCWGFLIFVALTR